MSQQHPSNVPAKMLQASGQNRRKILTIWYCILSTELTKRTPSNCFLAILPTRKPKIYSNGYQDIKATICPLTLYIILTCGTEAIFGFFNRAVIATAKPFTLVLADTTPTAVYPLGWVDG